MSRDRQGASAVDAARSLLTKLASARDEYRTYIRKELLPLYTADRRLPRIPPKEYNESSFLFIRGFPGDRGTRPFLGRILWRSPDILIEPLAPPAPTTSTLTPITNVLKVGTDYRVRVTVRNAGDRIIPSAKVELWLSAPGAGRNTNLARHLTANAIPSIWVDPLGTATLEYLFAPRAEDVGKRSLLARVFAFSPLDLPVHNHELDPMQDRHVAELIDLTVVP